MTDSKNSPDPKDQDNKKTPEEKWARLLEAGLTSDSGTESAGDSKLPGAGSTPPDETPLEILSAELPNFEFLEVIGRGGMGVVYRARQVQLDRIVAVKIINSRVANSPQFEERFKREARAMARLNHPNIVMIYEFGISNGRYFLVMEYVDGTNLRAILRSSKMSPAEALEIVPQVCDALQYAHEEGVVHRDIKPENILFDRRGRVKIADFGLAKLVGGQEVSFGLSDSHVAMGTPHYMAPEQFERPSEVDHRTDVFALGVVFYEMLTGEVPMGRFAEPSKKVAVDVRIDEVVLRALERDPDMRYQKVSDVRTDIDTVRFPPMPPPSDAMREIPSVVAPPQTPNRQKFSASAILAFALMLIGILLIPSVRDAVPGLPMFAGIFTVAMLILASVYIANRSLKEIHDSSGALRGQYLAAVTLVLIPLAFFQTAAAYALRYLLAVWCSWRWHSLSLAFERPFYTQADEYRQLYELGGFAVALMLSYLLVRIILHRFVPEKSPATESPVSSPPVAPATAFASNTQGLSPMGMRLVHWAVLMVLILTLGLVAASQTTTVPMGNAHAVPARLPILMIAGLLLIPIFAFRNFLHIRKRGGTLGEVLPVVLVLFFVPFLLILGLSMALFRYGFAVLYALPNISLAQAIGRPAYSGVEPTPWIVGGFLLAMLLTAYLIRKTIRFALATPVASQTNGAHDTPRKSRPWPVVLAIGTLIGLSVVVPLGLFVRGSSNATTASAPTPNPGSVRLIFDVPNSPTVEKEFFLTKPGESLLEHFWSFSGTTTTLAMTFESRSGRSNMFQIVERHEKSSGGINEGSRSVGLGDGARMTLKPGLQNAYATQDPWTLVLESRP